MKNNLIMDSSIMLQINNSEKQMSKFTKLYFWYYKLIGVNFGGYSLDQNGFLKKSFAWKLYGYLLIIISSTILWYTTAMIMCTDEIKIIKQSNRPFLYELILISWLVRDVLMPLVTLIIGQKYGLKLIRLTMKYPIENRKLEIVFKSFWSIHIIVCLSLLLFDYYHYVRVTNLNYLISCLNLIIAVTEDFIYISIDYSISFLCWRISFAIYDRLKKMNKQLLKSKCNLYELIILRKQFLEMRNELIQADSYTRFCFFVDCASITFTLMLDIYIFIVGNSIKAWFASFISYCLIITPKLIGDCIICGMVHDQADQLLKSVHQIDFDIKNDRFYKELMLFKTINSEVNYGFTIGGLVPLERTALLSVIMLIIYLIEILNKISINIFQIFCFVLSFTILLIQTAG